MDKMDPKYAPLFTPWKIGNVEIKNRIVLCPMGGTSLFGWMEPNHFDKEAAKFFLERAKNNVGLIIPGIAPIKDTMGGRWLWQNKKMRGSEKDFRASFLFDNSCIIFRALYHIAFISTGLPFLSNISHYSFSIILY